MSTERLSNTFDYSMVGRDIEDQLRESEVRINGMLKRTTQTAIEIGKELVKVKSILEHGQFISWVKSRLGWSQQTACNFMNVATKFQNFGNLPITPSAAYALVSKSSPPEALEAAVDLASAGEEVTHSLARQIIAEVRLRNESDKGQLDFFEALNRLRWMIDKLRERWPQDRLRVLPSQLRIIAEDLEQEIGDPPCSPKAEAS